MKLNKTSGRLEQLIQIAESPVWDGNLISKTETKELEKSEFIERAFGISFITRKGIECLCHLGIIKI